MKQEVMKKWVKALESGKYRKGKTHLNKKGSYCCLGVLCELAEKEGVFVERTEDGYVSGGTLEDQLDVQKWAGLRDSCGAYGGGVFESLINLNDGNYRGNLRGKSFKKIAEFIKKNWKKL